MNFPERELVQDLPSGLCACRLNGENMHLAAISPRCLYLHTQEAPLAGTLQLYLLQPKTGRYDIYNIANYETGQAWCENGAVLTRFSFEDSACAAAIRRMLNDYARYLEIKSCGGAEAYARYTADYPAEQDEVFCASPEEQSGVWYAQLPPVPQPPKGCELAVELNCPDLWRLYLDTPLPGFMDAYAANRGLARSKLPASLPQRLYIGNAFCRHLFPGEAVLAEIAAKARREGLELTLVTAELRAGGEEAADRCIALARELQAELVVNDWGMLQRAQDVPGLQLLLGTQLNRRRKDPRMQYKCGMQERSPLLACNALNDGAWLAFLGETGFVRYEYESCGLPTLLPDAPCSLHLPFYQTNTALWCPLRAICERGDRGAQSGGENCLHWCNENLLLYPDHLKMLGKWNSLFALDAAFPASLQGFDRWVLNF